VKLDTHVHTVFSGRTTIYPLSLIMNESYNSPEGVYRRAKARGMDLVAITDHDTIDGALTLADRSVGRWHRSDQRIAVAVAEPHRGRDEFMAALHAGRVVTGGRQGHNFTMAFDMLRLAAGFYEDRLRLAARKPLDWRRQTFVLCGVLGMPLVRLPLAAALGHFMLEERFNQRLLFDLAARPAVRLPEAA
jgi:hypothetical protein